MLPANSLLKFVAIIILGHLLRIVKGNKYVIVMTDRYSNLERAIETGKTSYSYKMNVFFVPLIAAYGIPTNVLTDYGV